MRILSIIAIAVGIFALAGAAFAYGPGMGGGMGGGWGGHMMGGSGYQTNGNWGGHMGGYWDSGNNGNYYRQDAPRNYGTRNGWNRGNPEAPRGWNNQQAPEPAPGIDR